MNPAHLHLITTHVPVLGTFFGLCLLLLALLRKSEDLRRVALLVFVAAALTALPSYFSGQPASNLLRRLLPGTTADAGDQHAEVAIVALLGVLALGVAALVGLVVFRKGRSLPAGFLIFVLLLAGVACGLLGWTANLGGRIRHLEIRPQSSMLPVSAKDGWVQHTACAGCAQFGLLADDARGEATQDNGARNELWG